MDQLTIQLANALNIEPADILDIAAARDGGFNVVLDDYRKYRNVEPKPIEPSELEQLSFVKSASSAKSAVQSVVVPGTEMYIPEELQAAYTKPHRSTIKTLKELCELLEIETPKRIKKSEIVKLINEWKLEHAP
jgi:DNA-binding Xre family transcriptional regulator